MPELDRLLEDPRLVAFWDFNEEAGNQRRARVGRGAFPLNEINGAVATIDDAPLGGRAVTFDNDAYLGLPNAKAGDLDISGPDAAVSMFAVVRMRKVARGGTVAGMWYEGLGPGDDSGTRQYALLLDMNLYGGAKRVTPHVSSEGGATRRADGSLLPWCVDYAATVEEYPADRWCTMGMTYDGTTITAFLDGVAEPRTVDPEADNRADPYFTNEGPSAGHRGINPFHHGRGIFRYDPVKHAETKPAGPSDFVVGARCVRGRHGAEPLDGALAGLAVFDASLTPEEMLALHRASLT
ncbi:MAG: hypothetical protein AAF561_04285 [Planctomycetota bacterium]